MGRNVWLGVTLFVGIVLICCSMYSTADDNSDLIRAIKNLTRSIEALESDIELLNRRVDELSRRIGTQNAGLTGEMGDLQDAVEKLERTIRKQ